MKKRKGRRSNVLKGAIYALLVTWILLLLLLILIYSVRLQGYSNFQEWWAARNGQETPAPTGVSEAPLSPGSTPPDPLGSGTPGGTLVPGTVVPGSPVPDPSGGTIVPGTPVGTSVPGTIVPGSPEVSEGMSEEQVAGLLASCVGATEKEYGQPVRERSAENGNTMWMNLPETGSEAFNLTVRTDLEPELSAAWERLTAAPEEAETALLVDYDSYLTGVYVSFVFHVVEYTCIGGEETTNVRIVPLVYDTLSGERRTGTQMFPETYFAILKERLMSYVEEMFPEAAGSPFLSWKTVYVPADYGAYYLKGDAVYFYFPEDTLAGVEHTPFSYRVSFEEAKAFLCYDLSDGTKYEPFLRSLDPNRKMVALTFDDGPYPRIEQKLLELFRQHDARVTFFFVGNRVTGSYADMVRTIAEAGHEVGNHSWSHKYLLSESVRTFWEEVNKTTLVLAETTGRAPAYMRTPGGQYGDYTHNLPYPMISWSVSGNDWVVKNDKNGAKKIYDKIVGEVQDGDIILLHSLYDVTAEAVEDLLVWLDEKGYQMVTISELFYYKGIPLENGERYFDAR